MKLIRPVMWVCLIGTLLLAAGQIGRWYGDLPDEIVSRFKLDGEPSGTMPKQGFFVTMGLCQLLFLIGFPILGWAARFLPDSSINIPHREIWLAEAHRQETFGVIALLMNLMGLTTSWLLLGLTELTCRVGAGQRDNLGSWAMLALLFYMLAIGGLVTWLMLRFRRPPASKRLPS